MWVYSTSCNADRSIRIFKYATGRAGDNAKDFLKGFNGFLHTDAYSGYISPKERIGNFAEVLKEPKQAYVYIRL